MSERQSPFYSVEELQEIGFSSVGTGSRISRKASLYGISGKLGDHVRIDDFCILKGRIEIGSYVHVASFCSLSGVGGAVKMDDFSTFAPRVSVFTASDDYYLPVLNNPLLPARMKNVIAGDVHVGIGVIVGAHSVLLPNIHLGDGASIGAMVIVNRSIPAGGRCVNKSAKATLVGQRDVEQIYRLIDEFRASA